MGEKKKWTQDSVQPPQTTETLNGLLAPRSYQLEVLEKAKQENTIVYLETGTGKTLIAAMLLQSIAHRIRKPSRNIAVFLGPTVCLIQQQGGEIKKFTDLEVGMYWGDMNVDTWKCETWQAALNKYEVFVMTPEILYQNLHHCFMTMESIELLIFDECHHARKHHRYACIMQEFYHTRVQNTLAKLPRIFGMTASPIDGKVELNGEGIAHEFDELESMLHSKVYTVKDRSELDMLVPCPQEEIKLYNAPAPNQLETQHFGLALAAIMEKCVRVIHAGSRNGEGELEDAALQIERKMLKSLEKLHSSLLYCLNELGLWCCYKAVEILIGSCQKKIGSKTEPTTMGETSCHKEAFLTEVLGFLKAQNLAEIDEERKLFLASNKVQALINILMHHRDVKDMRCIVFVERKIATKVLVYFLSSIAMFASSFQFQSLAGKTEGMDSMTRKLQQEAVQSFRAGHVNVLVSTNVAEEGLDIQSCCLVIRFDLPKTPSSLIQSRGRARCKGSTYVYLVERGNNDQFERLQLLKWKESLMKEQALSRIERMESVGSPQTQGPEMFQIETTGASISTQYSISLLHQYCGRLPRDSFYTPAPKFTYTMENSGDIRCSIVLPPESLIKTVKGWACSTRNGAKQSACFEACKQLHEAGALSDLFLINCDDPENDDMGFLAADDDDIPAGKAQQELHPLFVPDVFQGSWSQASSCVTLYGYTINFVPKPSDRSYTNFRLFVESDLGEEVVNSLLQLELQSQRVVEAQCSSAGKLEFEPDQIRDAKIFQERALSALLDQNPGSREAGEWSPSRLYLLLPLQSHDLDDNPHPPVDWECVKKLISDPTFVEDQDCPNEPSSLQADWSSSSSSLHTCTMQLANGHFPVEAIQDSIVETTHSREPGPFFYCGSEVLWDLNANSPMKNQGIKNDFSCYAQYFSEKHSVQLVHRKQPMLNAKRLIGVQNLLTPRTIGSQGAPERKDKGELELPLELCYIKMQGFSCKLVNGVSLLPSFMHRLEARLLAAQLRCMLSQSYPAASQLSIDRMLEAITTAHCQESFSLEGLEHLGDSFLKFAVSERLFLIHNQIDEGRLTKRRKAIICNPMLQKLGTERGLTGYIQDAQFSPSDWLAPGRPLDLQKTKDTKTRLLHPKTIADVVESLIGAHYIEGGVDAALSFMKWLGLEVGVNLDLREQARMCSDWDQTLLESIDVIELEMLLDYKFNNKGLLVQALTHASCERSCGACYQRLEFLGDAVLDFSITKHYFETSAQEKRDPGKLTDLRSAAVNNEHFAQVAVRHKLYNYLLHNSLPLKKNIDKYVEDLRSAVTNDKSCYGWEGDNNPESLSDIVESLAGAVLLDSGFNCNTVWRVFKKLLAPLATAETVPIEPTRELRELCDEYKFENRKPTKIKDDNNNVLTVVTVVVNGKEISETASGTKGKSATKRACVQLLKKLKACGYQHKRWRTPGSYTKKVPKQSSEQCRVVRASLNDCNKTTEEAVCIHGSEAAQDLEIDNISESTEEAVCIHGLSEPAPDSEIDNILESTEEAVCVHGSKAAQDLEINNLSESTKEITYVLGSERAQDLEIDNMSESFVQMTIQHEQLMMEEVEWQILLEDDENGTKISEVSDTPEPPQRSRGATCGNGLTGNSELGKLCAVLLQDSKSKIPYSHSSSNIATTGSPHFDGAGVDRKFCRDTRHSSCEQQQYTQSAFTESLQTPIYVQEAWKMFSQLHPPQTCKEGQRLKNSSNSSSHNAGFMGGQSQDVGVDGSVHWFSPNPGQETNSGVGWHSIGGKSKALEKGQARSMLNELCVKHKWKEPDYKFTQNRSALFISTVTVTCALGKDMYEVDFDGHPMTGKKQAKDSAAIQALSWLSEQGIHFQS